MAPPETIATRIICVFERHQLYWSAGPYSRDRSASQLARPKAAATASPGRVPCDGGGGRSPELTRRITAPRKQKILNLLGLHCQWHRRLVAAIIWRYRTSTTDPRAV